MRVLVLGGTTEASRLAQALAGRLDTDAVLSLAGRTKAPVQPPIPFRIGGFGGVDGLAAYLRSESVAAVVDATHPFAVRISAHAAEACARLQLPLVGYSRLPWTPQPGDRWWHTPSIAAAVETLGVAPRRVFLTTGRLDLAALRAAPQHHYLIRVIDPPDGADLPPDHHVIQARGPFDAEAETALLQAHRIDVLVTKNSGGAASAAKLQAARALELPVVMVDRPAPADRPTLVDLDAVLGWIAAHRERP